MTNNYTLEDLKEDGLVEVEETSTIIKDINTANWAFRKLVEIEKKVSEVEALAKAELDRINNWKKEELKAFEDDKQFFEFNLEQYFREQKVLDPKFKLSTPYGKVTSRKQQPKWDYEDEKIIESLKLKGINNLIETETIEKLPKKEFKDSVEILQDVVSLNGVVKPNIKPCDGNHSQDWIDTTTGELQDPNLDFIYHKQVIACNGQIIDGVTVEEREDSITIKVEL